MGKFSDALEKSKTPLQINDIRVDDSDFKVAESDLALSEKTKQPDKIKQKNDTGEYTIEQEIMDLTLEDKFASEQFGMLKTKILFPDSGTPPKVLLVTSAAPSEGKSFVAANLAHAIAKNVNEFVLLMDCDLRLPTIQKYFQCAQGKKGLAEYLSDDKKLEDLLLRTQTPKLTLLSAGIPPENPTELLSSNKMRNLISEVKTRYNDRYIIIDSPPPLLAAETKAIARQVDGIIIVVRHEKTSKKELESLMELLDRDKVIGVIMNRYCNRLPKKYGYNKYY